MFYCKVLKLDSTKISQVVEDTAKGRMRPTLVQAISLHRQNKSSEIIKTIQNLVSQFRAFPHPVVWDCTEDIEGLYMDCVNQIESQKFRQEVAEALGLTDTEAKKLDKLAE